MTAHPARSSIAAALLLLLVVVVPSRGADAGSAATNAVVVTLDGADTAPAVVAAELGRRHGFTADHVFTTAVPGFAAHVPEQAVEQLQADPRVKRVEDDVAREIVTQSLPTGIDRTEADLNSNANGVDVGYDVAVIDTGIDADHSDLDVRGGEAITPSVLLSPSWQDDHGHGTHVAGTVGAEDDGDGVIGVAPGARLWAVKVCNAAGTCLTSDIVAGIDWVASQKAEFQQSGGSKGIDFATANMSISTGDSTNGCTKPGDAVHAAICGVVGEGVLFSLAAGNSGEEKQAYPVAFSVSAIADFDGRGGAAGSPTCRSDQDDTLADFSNHGSSIDIAAPGVCIRSTWNDGGYATISGTSMAAPHAAGAAVLWLHANSMAPAGDATGVAEIEDAIRSSAHPQGTANNPCSYDDSRTGGPLLFVNATTFGGTGECTVAGDGGGSGDDDGGTFPIDLSATGFKTKGLQKVDLDWNGATATNVDLYRDSVLVMTTPNDGSEVDHIDRRGGGTYVYVLCEEGSTDVCSNEATVTF